MKTTSIKLITIIGLISVLLLQVLWLHNIYSLHRKELKTKVDEVLYDSFQKEIIFRKVKHTEQKSDSDTALVVVMDEDDQFQRQLYIKLNESYTEASFPMSLDALDSIFHQRLIHENIHSGYYLAHIHTPTGEVLESTGKKPRTSWGSMVSDPVVINMDKTEMLQASLISPYRMIFGKMIFLFLATVIILALVIYCIIYQIRIIARQDRISRIREDFSHAMIHDMKSPINTILVGLNMLHSEKLLDKPEKRDNYYRIASDECQRLLSLADKVLTLAKMEQETLTLNKQHICLKPIVTDLAEKFSSKAGKPVRFEIKVNSEDVVYADGDYLREAISNLIENAIKYSGESVRVDIKRTVHEGHDHISVRDNGFGVPFKDQKKIFEKFERASAAGRKDRAKGLGLGLNYVNNVIQAHGGHIILRSIEGEYSEFILVLPRK